MAHARLALPVAHLSACDAFEIWIIHVDVGSHVVKERTACAGTSPLYMWPSIFSSAPSEEDVIGALSLVLWTLTLIVVIKYVVRLSYPCMCHSGLLQTENTVMLCTTPALAKHIITSRDCAK